MSKKKHNSHSSASGHYCRICGRYRANEKFSGKGHRNHICKDCARLPAEKRNEMETANRLMNLPFWLSKKQRLWLEKMKKDNRDEVREAAEYAYDLRFGKVVYDADEETGSVYDDIDWPLDDADFPLEEVELFYDDTDLLFEETDSFNNDTDLPFEESDAPELTPEEIHSLFDE